MILLIDNYDSFTYNIYQMIGEFQKDIRVVRNDAITVEDIKALHPEAIIISPGPGLPEDSGICTELIKELYTSIPILGICLGHQVIAKALGATIKKAKSVKHGKQSAITHKGIGPFSYLSQPLDVMRYHSYVVDEASLPLEFKVLAKSLDDSEIMSIQYKDFPVYGLQFHPESIGTETGQHMLEHFFEEINSRKEHAQ